MCWPGCQYLLTCRCVTFVNDHRHVRGRLCDGLWIKCHRELKVDELHGTRGQRFSHSLQVRVVRQHDHLQIGA